MVDGSFPGFYGPQKNRVDRALDRLLPPAETNRLAEAMRYSVLGGGKRVRGVLVLEAARLGTNVMDDLATRLSAIVELLHTYTLVHDDLPSMDNDDVRRGQPACHKEYDEATAILCGNALLSRAFESLSAFGDSPLDEAELLERVGRGIGFDGVLDGQVRDLDLEASEPTDETILEMYEKKTGYLIGLALEMGAMVGRLDEENRGRMVKIGRKLGMAFQIRDDLLERDSDSERLGKDAGSDRRKQKSTLAEVIGEDTARKRADNYISDAQNRLRNLPGDPARLIELADFIIERTY